MAIQDTLKRIEFDISRGDLGKARDRLHGLIDAYPDDLSLRSRIAEIYWQLQYPAMAGRYWYLEEVKSKEMMTACKAFEKECRNHPYLILKSLKFRGNIKTLDSKFAKTILLALQKEEQSRMQRERIKQRDQMTQITPPKTSIPDKIVLLVFITLAPITISLIVIGAKTVINFLF